MAELILALDLPTRGEALRLLDRLPALKWVKVGSILMTAEGPSLVRELVGRGLEVFLDLKWHDIPNTVAGAVAVAAQLGVRLATVHTSGGPDMLRAAVAQAGSVALVGVTVLTSQAATDQLGEASVADLVEQRARLAMECALSGVVCSVQEIQRVRSAIGPKALIVVPGIRRSQDDPGDQQRTAGPAEAVRLGATHLVVGRPILRAEDPARTLSELLGELT
jgi:orotidine-5'-phosphate decarboxylase